MLLVGASNDDAPLAFLTSASYSLHVYPLFSATSDMQPQECPGDIITLTIAQPEGSRTVVVAGQMPVQPLNPALVTGYIHYVLQFWRTSWRSIFAL